MSAFGWTLVALAWAPGSAAVPQQEPAETLTSEPLAQPSPRGATLFERLDPETCGIDFRSDFNWEHPNKHLYVHGYAGGGVALGDSDGDGRVDVFLTGQTTPSRLYRQTGAGAELRFSDATEASGLGTQSVWSTGAAFVDINADGALDLSVCSYSAPNRLYVNAGDGTFVDEAQKRGLDHRGASLMTGFADYDIDGDLDAYLVTYRRYGRYGRSPRTNQNGGQLELLSGEEDYFAVQERQVDGEMQRFIVQAGESDRLYRNDAGHFTDVSSTAGISGHDAGYSATWWDYDGDLRPDLYVCNDFWSADRLYHNEGDGTFRDVLVESVPHTPWFAMGADFGDLNGDGLFDFIAADMSASSHYWSKVMMGEMSESRWFLESAEPRQYMRNALYLNTGTPRFAEAAYLAGLASTDWTWSVKLADFDNDTRLDAFFTTGTANHSFDADLNARLRELRDDQNRRRVVDPRVRAEEYWRAYLEVPPRQERNLAFRNAGDLVFDAAGARWGLDHLGISFGAACADLDRDGDLDLVVNNVGDHAAVYRNGGSGAGTLIRLVGLGANTHGLGARLTLRTGEISQVRQVAPVRGYLSANEPLVHFGVGNATQLEELTVEWPSGEVQRFKDLPARNLHTIAQAADRARSPAKAPQAWLVPATPAGLAHTSIEREFDDYAAQPLLPAKLSQTGPALAWGDADGDGDDDLFIGGPAGQAGRLLLRGQGGDFVEESGPWSADSECEDTAILWIDVDGDGHLDLFVGSGGVEYAEGAELNADRVYLNAVTGFVKASERLPSDPIGANTSAAVAADFDRDGDLDVFVGARSVPGAYPQASRSRFLENDGGRLVDATKRLAPALDSVGLVTAALASDVDNDGDTDLLIAREWDSIALFDNEDGRLVDRTQVAGLSDRRGWWSSLAALDVDGDGDLDYVAGNAGLNTKYKASVDKPARLLRADFDGSGESSLVEAKAGTGAKEWLPVRGLSCSSAAMPFVREKLPTFRDFASAGLDDIYPQAALDSARVFEANELRSGVLVNNGGKFSFEALPRIAQIAPIYGCVAADIDADGRADLAVLQNSFQREPETGRWDGGLGLVLRGTERGLQALRADHSGMVVHGDGTALTTTDLNGDGRVDLVGTQNNGPLVALLSALPMGRPLAVRLHGTGANPSAVGARVELVGTTGTLAVAEVHAGSGALSQSGPTLFFGRPAQLDPELTLQVRWPDGSLSESPVDASATQLDIERD